MLPAQHLQSSHCGPQLPSWASPGQRSLQPHPTPLQAPSRSPACASVTACPASAMSPVSPVCASTTLASSAQAISQTCRQALEHDRRIQST